jgi:hypothetical protein
MAQDAEKRRALWIRCSALFVLSQFFKIVPVQIAYPIHKSYYHCFTAIKFAKPSWRAPQSMIPFIANPTKFVEKYRAARIYSPWRFLPPRNTPDQFCRRFTRQNHRCAAWAVFFFFTNKILCSCSIFQNLFLVVDYTTTKCYFVLERSRL